MEPNHDPKTATIQILGTDIFENVDENGRFTFIDLAPGKYNIMIKTTLSDYTESFYDLLVDNNSSNQLKDTLWVIYTGIPAVRGITEKYDTLNGFLLLSWEKTSFNDFQEYIIFKDDLNVINKSTVPIFNTTKTFFIDTIFDTKRQSGKMSINDTNDYQFKYRVAIRNNEEKEGTTYKFVDVIAASPQKVRPQIEINFVHPKVEDHKNCSTLFCSSINDAIQIISKAWIPFRNIKSISWSSRGIDEQELKNSEFTSKKDTILDTLFISWSDTGVKKILHVLEDEIGLIYTRGIDLSIIQDLPKIKNDTLIKFFNSPFNIYAEDYYGSIDSLHCPDHYKILCTYVSESELELTILDTLVSKFKTHFLIIDDDGNIVNDTLIINLDFEWEKISESFLDTHIVRSSFLFDSSIFVLSTPMFNYTYETDSQRLEYRLFKSKDGINWTTVFNNAPWKNWVTKPVVFKNKIWLIEAVLGSTDTNNIWTSSDGIAWESKPINDIFKWGIQTNLDQIRELIFLKLNDKLWIGDKHAEIGFWTSPDGNDWTSLDTSIYNTIDLHYNNVNAPTEYYSDNQNAYFVGREWHWGAIVQKTTDFLSITQLANGMDRVSSTINHIPLPIIFRNEIILTSSSESFYGGHVRSINDDDVWESFTYPGSVYHAPIIFKDHLYSISDEGVYRNK